MGFVLFCFESLAELKTGQVTMTGLHSCALDQLHSSGRSHQASSYLLHQSAIYPATEEKDLDLLCGREHGLALSHRHPIRL